MPLVGIIANNKEIKAIKKEMSNYNIDIIGITKSSIKNIKNIVFDIVVILQDIKLEMDEYRYMNEVISKTKYLVINADMKICLLKYVIIENPIRVITFGFNTKATITISSIKDNEILVCLQRDIKKLNGNIVEAQEKKIEFFQNSNKIYNKLAIFIIKEVHNL